MIGVMIVPTGVGAEIGGHAGDANPAAKLLGACCDKLILNPNVVNASDINEMPENALYVEGSILDRFLELRINLMETRSQNKILVATNEPNESTTSAVNAARVTIGADVSIMYLDTPLEMDATFDGPLATGVVRGWRELVKQVRSEKFDALAIHTPINVDRDVALDYWRNGGVNPWGGVEAKASRLIATEISMPVAHAPIENVTPDDPEYYNIHYESTDPRLAPEAISRCYLHCVLKGLNRAPRPTGSASTRGISAWDVDVMVSPYGCYGRPHAACAAIGIPIIVVKENKVVFDDTVPDAIEVENYWEAAGIIMAMKAGIDPASVRRPLI